MSGNGQRGIKIGVHHMGNGWVFFSVDEVPSDEARPSQRVNQALRDWLLENSVRVRRDDRRGRRGGGVARLVRY
jgi:hypothetical protein